MLQKISKVLSDEVIFILFLTFAVAILGLGPLFYFQWKIAPKGTTYTFAHNYMPDFYQYLSWMKDGADGKFLITSRFSAENFIRKPVYLFYPALGFLTSKLGLPLFYGYTLGRIFFSLFKIFVVYFFIISLFKESTKRKTAFFLALFSPPFYRLFPLNLILDRISSVDVLQRTFFIPHNLLTASLYLLGTIFFSRFLNQEKNSRFYLFLAAFCFFLAAVANPAMLVLIFLIIGFSLILTLTQNFSLFKRLFLGSLIAFLPAGLLLIYYQKLFQTTLPFSWMYFQQKTVTLGVGAKDYLLSCGPTGFLFLFGLPHFLKKKNFLYNFIISWAVLPFAFLPLLGKILPLSQERLFELSHFVPLAILASEGVFFLSSLIKNVRKKIVFKKILFTAFFIFIIPYYYLSLNFQIKLFNKPYFNVYLPNSILEAFSWLDKNTPDESIVVSAYFTANMLPAFSHNKVIFGHDFVTYQAAAKKKEMEAIFNPLTPPNEIKKLLKENKVDYILLSPETGNFENVNLKTIPELKIVYKNKENTILKVKDF